MAGSTVSLPERALSYPYVVRAPSEGSEDGMVVFGVDVVEAGSVVVAVPVAVVPEHPAAVSKSAAPTQATVSCLHLFVFRPSVMAVAPVARSMTVASVVRDHILAVRVAALKYQGDKVRFGLWSSGEPRYHLRPVLHGDLTQRHFVGGAFTALAVHCGGRAAIRRSGRAAAPVPLAHSGTPRRTWPPTPAPPRLRTRRRLRTRPGPPWSPGTGRR
jgi:hypothetical protein